MTTRVALAGFLRLAATAAAQDQEVVLRGARVLTAADRDYEAGTVVLHGGKIIAVGDGQLAHRKGARVIECKGLVITPGLIDAGATFGVRAEDSNEQGDEVTPQVSILDAIAPDDVGFARARGHGVTTVRLSPSNRNVIGGLAAVLKTKGETVADMVLKERAGLRLAMGSEPSANNRAIRGGVPLGLYVRRPTTRMGVVWEVRQAFSQAQKYRDQRTQAEGVPPDAALDVLVEALAGQLDVHTTARAEQDIRTALRLAAEFGYKTVLDEATEAYRCIDVLAASKVACLVGAPSAEAILGGGAMDGARPRWHTPSLLAQAGVAFAIQTGANLGSKALVHEALFAVRHGLGPDAALRAITATPAKILGVDERVGSLLPGKDADVVVWSGDPFAATTVPAMVFIDGEEVSS
jgi:imidazolonepropionase-like amidohydrolase